MRYDRARQAGNTQEATMREEAAALLPLLEKCFGGGTNFFALIRLRRRATITATLLRLASGAALGPES